ncbi:MAG: tyrosine-type recombinase/integrase [Anaerolineae bacterium]|nr:tyrosine-type recombinase/integrase [Anaerolineae bacterium]
MDSRLSTTSTLLKAYLGSRQDQDPALWLGKRGALSYQGLQDMVERRAAQAGFDKYRVHAHVIRKMFATRWIANGGDERSLQELIGWMSPKMLEIYVKISRREVLGRLHRDLSPVDHWYSARSAPDSTAD